MSYLINYAAISSQKTDFDNYYNEFISSNDLPQLEKTVQIMADLSEVIQTVLQDTPPYVSGFFSNWISQPRTENNQEILRDVSEKLDAMIHRIQQLSSQTVVPIVPRRLTFSSRIKTDAEDFAVGFGNMSNNCWANSLLSMIVCIPSLKEIYNAVANCYAQQNEDGAKKKCGILMQGAMRAYEIALSQKSALGSQVSQDVRMAFHGLFGHTDLGTQREIFSSSCHAQEDAYEALQLLMSEYQKVTKTPTRRLYCPLETTRRYAPYGVQKNADIDRIPSPDGTCQSRLGAYSQLDSDNATRQCCLDYQIFLDMQSMSNLSFSEMFNRFFNNRHVNDYENAEYLLPDRKVQKFKLAAEERKFLEIPQELSLTLKRFGSDMYGNSFKITTPVAVEKVLCLPASATPENKPIPYELTAFIVHSGGISGGHYICYKKVEGRWIEANDSRVRFVTEHEIDEILQGKKGEYFTSYMHHYSRSNSCESVTSAAEQRTQNALQQCIAQELREKLAMQTLEALPNFISSGSTCLESVPSHVLSTLHHAIWLNDKTPNINEYGTKELEKNPQ